MVLCSAKLFLEQQGHDLAAFTGEDVVSPTSRQGVHSLESNAPGAQMDGPGRGDESQAMAATKKHEFTIVQLGKMKISLLQVFKA